MWHKSVCLTDKAARFCPVFCPVLKQDIAGNNGCDFPSKQSTTDRRSLVQSGTCFSLWISPALLKEYFHIPHHKASPVCFYKLMRVGIYRQHNVAFTGRSCVKSHIRGLLQYADGALCILTRKRVGARRNSPAVCL